MRPENGGVYAGPVIDCCIHHSISDVAMYEYLPQEWQDYVGKPNTVTGGLGMRPFSVPYPWRHPLGDKRKDTVPENGGQPGSDYAALKTMLDDNRIEKALLAHDSAINSPAGFNPEFTVALAEAYDNWTIDAWLSRDKRLHGVVIAANQLPERAAQEIRRVGRHSQMAAVLLGGNGIGKPFGHPLYHPIYEAAADMDLPILLHAGGDAPMSILTSTAAGGLPATYSEHKVMLAMPLMMHLVTLVGQGVFQKYPNLKVIVAGAGIAWIPAFFWRMDVEYRGLRRDIPWLRVTPSEFLRDRLRVVTYPLDAPVDHEALIAHMKAFGGLELMTCYGSGYPNQDLNEVADIANRIPAAWHSEIFVRNAEGAFRW